MKIYLDTIFLLNFSFDFLLLLVVNIILRRNISVKRMICGAIFGGLSIFLLFIKINNFILFFFKILISIIMILITFKYKNKEYFIKNFIFLYSSSMILGGFLYFLNTQFSYKQEGLVFYHDGLSINFIFLIIFSPIILYIYVRQGIELKTNYSNYYKVKIYIQDEILNVVGFLDTGNKLMDPYTKKPIIIINEKLLKKINYKIYIVPINTIKEEGFLKCTKIKKIEIEGIGERKNVVLGLTNKLQMEGIDCILHSILLEE